MNDLIQKTAQDLAGATVIEINLEETSLTQKTSDYIIMGKAGEIMKRLTSEVERLI